MKIYKVENIRGEYFAYAQDDNGYYGWYHMDAIEDPTAMDRIQDEAMNDLERDDRERSWEAVN